MSDTESPQSSLFPSHDARDDTQNENGDAPRVSSLRPVARTGVFSMRRLLNVASVAVAIVALLALAVHWLPDVLPKPPDMSDIHWRQTFDAQLPPHQGDGWKPIGPDWATSIAFTSSGARGYVCGVYPPNPLVFFAVYDTRQQTWTQYPTPATGSSCHVYVSPDAGSYVLLAVNHCPAADNPSDTCANSLLASRLYGSYDGGMTWEELPLPAVMNVSGVAWANSTLFVSAQGNIAPGSASIPPNAPSYLFAYSWDAGFVAPTNQSFVEITAQQLVGRPMQFGNISLTSDRTTLYASLDGMSCASYCTIQTRSADTGAHWTPFAASYNGSPIGWLAPQPYSHTLIGMAFLPSDNALTPLRSFDNGDSWQELPAFPRNPDTGGANIFALPNGSVYAFCYGSASVVYALGNGATRWQAVASLPVGEPLTVQYDANGRAVALWAQARQPDGNGVTPGLAYYPLANNAP